ncbi:carbohydrate ABC transporter permease [Clostridium fallax]|uniref:Carbohydrate ABC transporter membrane protein 1, CUT1 family n=1 Tax=Clostridium fallax TaxID=1533 RepID=A0A1M4XDA6_9CLOT|nr:sugar ABC transporter permease [Clostridium fallax]SHE91559.1 carbohydrate ABC transporter membrane protein 1, CUT1 family [Clostridium fallax]SQB05965.1 binding-protein-dependent transport system inner membrane component [Clostridium fallax]
MEVSTKKIKKNSPRLNFNKKFFKDNGGPILFIIPAFILYTFFFINPVIKSVYLSLVKWNGIPNVEKKFIGFDNFIKFFKDPAFYKALFNVSVFIVVSFVIIMPIAYLLALLVSSKIRGIRFFKTSYFIPAILPTAATGLLWTLILYKSGGALNAFLEVLGLGSLTQDWLGDPKIAIFTVALVNAWVFIGYNMLIFVAGLTNIPEEIVEAAKVDGATGFKAQIYIVLPLMKESFKIFAVLAVAGSFKVFDIIYVMTGGGPGGATDVPATMLYDQAFRFNNFGYGSSIGIFILMAALISTVILNKILNTKGE